MFLNYRKADLTARITSISSKQKKARFESFDGSVIGSLDRLLRQQQLGSYSAAIAGTGFMRQQYNSNKIAIAVLLQAPHAWTCAWSCAFT